MKAQSVARGVQARSEVLGTKVEYKSRVACECPDDIRACPKKPPKP